MKKFLLSALAIFGMASYASADVSLFYVQSAPTGVTATNSLELTNNSENNVLNTPYTAGDITLTFEKVNDSESNVNGAQLRWYANDILNVSTTGNQPITQIIIQASQANYVKDVTPNVGEVTLNTNNNTIVWSGNTTEPLTLVASAQIRLTYIAVYYGSDAPEIPDTPTVPETPTDVISVAQAIKYIVAGGTSEITVKGVVSQIDSFNSNYGSITYWISDEGTDNTMEVYSGLSLNSEKFTSVDDIAVGAVVEVRGTVQYYKNETPEFNYNNYLVSYLGPNGETTPGVSDTPTVPEAPTEVVNVAQAIEYIIAGGTAEITVKGVVSQIDSFNSNYGSITYWISDEGTDYTMEVYSGLSLNSEKFTSANDIAVGAVVEVRGTVQYYQNTTPEFNYNNYLVSYLGPNGETAPGNDLPTIGPSAEIITVAEALELIENGYNSEATVEGYIISITEISTEFGNATYVIADEANATEGLTIFRGKYLEGAAFTSEDQLAVGGKVVVKGTLTLYGGTTPEMNTGNILLSYTAPAGGGDEGTDQPEEIEGVTFNFVENNYGLEPVYDPELGNDSPYLGEDTNIATLEGITVTFTGNDEDGNNWRLWSDGLRAYRNRDAAFTVAAGGKKITGVTWTAKSGATFALEGTDTNITSWTGSAESVTFVYTNTEKNLALETLTVAIEETGTEEPGYMTEKAEQLTFDLPADDLYASVELLWPETVTIVNAETLAIPVSMNGEEVGKLTSTYVNLVPAESGEPGIMALAETGDSGQTMFLLLGAAGLAQTPGTYSIDIPAGIVANADGELNQAQNLVVVVAEGAVGVVSPAQGTTFSVGEDVIFTITFNGEVVEQNYSEDAPVYLTNYNDIDENMDWEANVIYIENNAVVLNFGNELPEGTYYFSFRDAQVVVDGSANEAILDYMFVVAEGPTVGIEGIETDLEGAEIFNLQGVKVNNPVNGIFIIRQGDNVRKVMIRK